MERHVNNKTLVLASRRNSAIEENAQVLFLESVLYLENPSSKLSMGNSTILMPTAHTNLPATAKMILFRSTQHLAVDATRRFAIAQ